MINNIQNLTIHLNQTPIGTLAQKENKTYFEYHKEFLKTNKRIIKNDKQTYKNIFTSTLTSLFNTFNGKSEHRTL